ncbi:hypothetical protein ACFXGI_38525 [Streptomyces sp. NPDC059355]|uniref:hypothetical protein n=1 Tax=Streptomyces sp. NPDC059355 TaxID=3346811 RepID=UPI0036B10AC7
MVRGFSSQSYADVLRHRVAHEQREAHLAVVGDFDCSGEDIERDWAERTGCWRSVTRVLLTYEQMRAYGLPATEGKRGDPSWPAPPLTWTADHRWRRRMARAFDDLAGDLAKGNWPHPTCTAEELALHLAVEDAPMYLEDREEGDDHNSLPEHEDDYSWDSCSDLLFQDHDVLMLFHTKFSGIEDPENPTNQSMGEGDLREAAWFTACDNRSIRDPRRGFRR